MKFTVQPGMNQDILKNYPDDHFDSIVTDPPYGIEFLGKDWDSNTGAIETWQECLRVLKPGGHLLAFSAARTYHHLATNIESVGFEIRDQLMWIYASGFPKSQQVKEHPGWKTALKPGHEPIVMARKPFKGSTYANMNTHGVGALNIDACRIPATDKAVFPEGEYTTDTTVGNIRPTVRTADTDTDSRYPTNVMGEIPDYQKYFYCPKVSRAERHCGFETENIATGNNIGDGVYEPGTPGYTQNGTLGRMKDKMHQPQVGNNHPTVKPVALMRYLIQLVTPAEGRVLDPFTGSGSTGMACVELGYDFTGCELDPNYVEIAQKRIESWYKQQNPTNFNELFS